MMQWFRPYITVGLTIAITIGFFTGKIDPQAFSVFATGLIVWWMKSRDEEKNKRQGGRAGDKERGSK